MNQAQSKAPPSMQGFTLLETLISMILVSAGLLYSLHWQKIADSIDKGRILGQQYITLNDAVNNYMVTHSQKLNALNPVCSEVAFSFDPSGIFGTAQSRSPSRMSTDCRMVVSQNVTITNGLQPTIEELVTLGFHPKQEKYDPRLKMSFLVKEPNLDGSAPTDSSPYSVARFFINIQQLCLQRGTPNSPTIAPTASITPTANGCPSNTTTALSSLIFNTQPYYFNAKDTMGSFAFPSLIGSAILKIGADALRSDYTDTNLTYSGELRNSVRTTSNPIRYSDSSHNINVGLNGIIAMSGGYGASYANQHSRVDGSNVPTSDWSFGAHSITDVNNLTVLNQLTTDAVVVNKLKLADRLVNLPCDATKENLAQQGELILICKQGVWGNMLRGTINANEYYDLIFANDLTHSNSLVFTYCKDSACNTPTNIGNFSETANTISTQLLASDWAPVVQGVSYANADVALPSKLAIMLQTNPDGTLSVLLNYQRSSDLAKLQLRFYRINS